MPVAIIYFVALIAATSVQTCSISDDNRVSYIFGGSEAIPHEFPWMISLELTVLDLVIRREVLCGGSIISDQWVVTAAHCVDFNVRKPELFAVIAGVHDLAKPDSSLQKLRLDKVLLHPDYIGPPDSQHDIALLRTNGRFRFDNRTVAPIRLPKRSDYFAFECKMCVTMGRGEMRGGAATTVLRKVNVPTERLLYCALIFPYHEFIESQLCAGTSYLDDEVCFGDSGGPLVCVKDGAYMLAGVTSVGVNCSDRSPFNPAIFTRVSSYRDWIDNMLSVFGHHQ